MELCFPLRFCKVKTVCAEKTLQFVIYNHLESEPFPEVSLLSMNITRCLVWVENSAPGRQWSCKEGHGRALPGTGQLQSMPKVGIICSCQKHRTAAKLLTTPTQPTRDQIRLNEAVVWPSAVCSVGSGPGEAILPGLLSQMQICLLTRLLINYYILTSGTPCFSGEGHHLTQTNSNSWCFYLFRCWFFF